MRYTLLALMALFLFTSCKKENTVWETDWSVPVINDTLSLSNLVNDSTLAETGGFYSVDLNRSLFDISINEFVEIPDTTVQGAFGTTFPFISVTPGLEFVNEEEELVLNIADVQLKEIITGEGFIDIELINPIETMAFFTINLPGITKDGIPFVQTYNVPAGSASNPASSSNTISLNGYQLDLTGISGNERNTLRSVVTVVADPAGPTVTMTNTDTVRMNVTLRGMQIDYARGYFGNQIISDTTEVDLDLLNMVQSGVIDLPNTTVKFEVNNGVKVGARALLNFVKNENSSGTIVSLNHPQLGTDFNIDPALGSWSTLSPSQKLIVFDDANSNIEEFLENLGAKNTLGYRIEMNPWGNVSGGNDEIFPQSRLGVNLHVNMPLTVGTNALVVRDTFEVDLIQDLNSTHVVSGEMLLTSSNAFPFSGDVTLKLVNSNGSVLHTISGSQRIQSAQYGSLQAATNLMVANSDVKFVLNEAALVDINDVKSIIVESEFNSMNPITSLNEQMSIPVGAFLGVKLRTRFTTQNQF